MTRTNPEPGTSTVSGPLTGRCVVVTRPETHEGPLSTLLQDRGARVLLWPSVKIRPPEDIGPLRLALSNMDSYDWIIFTSPRAAAAVTDAADHPPSGPPAGPRVAAVGESTARTLKGEGWPVHFIPMTFEGEALLSAFRERDWAMGANILFPAGSIARETVPQGLRELGATVHQLTVYINCPAPLDKEACLMQFNRGEVDAVTFASPSAVGGLELALGRKEFALLLKQTSVVAIGQTTAEALREVGQPAHAVADPSTLEGMVDAVVALLRKPNSAVKNSKQSEREETR